MVPLSLAPGFPAYTGPYKVGSVDVEVPVKELSPVLPSPDPAVTTLSVRVFYPCDKPKGTPPRTYWFPNPQHEYLSAYLRFLGTNSKLANFLSYFPRLLYYISLPVLLNAPILHPTTQSNRWPTMIFSHGLGGTRNMYSHVCGSLASHGVVVVAPEHKDGSAPISFVRGEDGAIVHPVHYESISHENSRGTQRARNQQLKQRLWEMGETYNLLLALDKGSTLSNYALTKKERHRGGPDLSMFAHTLEVHRPGAVHIAGHSFGAATALQFLKSVFYDPSTAPSSYHPLYNPPRDSALVHQITPNTPVSLLDCWMLPTLDPSTRWLHDQPLPSYIHNGPGGRTVLAILSEGFYRWNSNLLELKRAVSPDPTLDPSVWTVERLGNTTPPHIFYPVHSAHLSQSDFGVLFPWLARRAFDVREPERTIRLNVRAILEVWRGSGAELAETSSADMEVVQQQASASSGTEEKKSDAVGATGTMMGRSGEASLAANVPALSQDEKILLKDGSVRGWIALSLGDQDAEGEGANKDDGIQKDADRIMEEETNGINA